MSDDISRILQLVTRLDENSRAQGDQIFMLADEMRAFRDEHRAQREELNAVRAELTAQGEKLMAQGEKMIALRTDLMARMDRLQDSITAIRDDIGVNMGAADRAVEANDHTRAEVRSLGEVVTAMGRQIQRLQADVRALKGEP